MKRGFSVEAAEVQVVSSVKEYQDRVARESGKRPPVLQSAREAIEGAPPTKTMSDVVKK